jgi:hypothetical protein
MQTEGQTNRGLQIKRRKLSDIQTERNRYRKKNRLRNVLGNCLKRLDGLKKDFWFNNMSTIIRSMGKFISEKLNS